MYFNAMQVSMLGEFDLKMLIHAPFGGILGVKWEQSSKLNL